MLCVSASLELHREVLGYGEKAGLSYFGSFNCVKMEHNGLSKPSAC